MRSRLKANIIEGRQTRKLLKDSAFDAVLEGEINEGWEATEKLVTHFLGKEESYPQIARKLLRVYEKMSLKICFPQFHLEYFSENCGDENEEHGDQIHLRKKQSLR